MSASALPPEARSASDPSVPSTAQLASHPAKPHPLPIPLPPPPPPPPPATSRPAPLPRSRKQNPQNHTARGESISLARRAAAVAKKKREHARAQFERQGLASGIDNVLRNFVSANASTRPNVSQNKSRRHKRVKWTQGEVDALRTGVQKHGEGRWAVILRENAHCFHPVRISVDLKDKWRNLSKSTKPSMRRPAATAPAQSPTTPITSVPPASTNSTIHPSAQSTIHPSAQSTISSWPHPPSAPPQSSHLEHKPAFRALPPVAPSQQLHHQSPPPANILTPKLPLTHVVNQPIHISSPRVAPRPHRPDNLPPVQFRSLSRPLPDPFDAIHTSPPSAVNAPTSSQFGTHTAMEPKVAALVNPPTVSVLVPRSEQGHPFDRRQQPLRPTHPQTSTSSQPAIRQPHSSTALMNHAPPLHPAPPARPQPYTSVAQLYSPPPDVATARSLLQHGPVSRTYSLHQTASTRPAKPSPIRFASSPVHHQSATQPLESEAHHFRHIHNAKEPAPADQNQDMQSLPHHEESTQVINQRFNRYAPSEHRDLPHRDISASRPLPVKSEALPTPDAQEDSHLENAPKLRERDDEASARNHSQNIIGQSDENSLHHLRPSPIHSDNRFGPEPREEVNSHVRVTASEDRFVPEQRERGDDLSHHRSSHSNSRFDRHDDEGVPDELEHSSANSHLGIDGQQGLLVRTGEHIHNEDSMRHVEVPREVLDNDDEDGSDGDIDPHAHTDPNHSNLYHGNDDDEDDDELAPHHTFGLVNHEDEHSNAGVPRVHNQQQPVNALGLTDEQPENGIELDVPIIGDASSGEYGRGRNRDHMSSTAEPEHEVHRAHFTSLARNGSGKSSQRSDTVEDDSHRNVVRKRKGRAARNAHDQHHSKHTQCGVRVSRHSASDNVSSAHGSEQYNREVVGIAGRAVSCLVDADVNHDRDVVGGVSQLSSDARDGALNEESQDLSASMMQCNDSELAAPKAQLSSADAHLDDTAEGNESSQRMVDGRDISISARAASTRSFGFTGRGDRTQFGRVHNAGEELSARSREASGNGSGGGTSRESIPLLNPANNFCVMRIKSSGAGRDRASKGSGYGFDRGGGRDERYGYEGKEESEGRHRVEDVASVANLLNPDCVDESSHGTKTHKRSHGTERRGQGERREGKAGMDSSGRHCGSMKRAKTGRGG